MKTTHSNSLRRSTPMSELCLDIMQVCADVNVCRFNVVVSRTTRFLRVSGIQRSHLEVQKSDPLVHGLLESVCVCVTVEIYSLFSCVYIKKLARQSTTLRIFHEMCPME